MVPGFPAVLCSEACFSTRQLSVTWSPMEPHSQPLPPPIETEWGLGAHSGRRVLKVSQAPDIAPLLKSPAPPCPPDQGPGHVVLAQSGSRRFHRPCSRPSQSPHPLGSNKDHSPFLHSPHSQPQLLRRQQGLRTQVDMSLITAWLGCSSFYLFEPWFPLLQNGRRAQDEVFGYRGRVWES